MNPQNETADCDPKDIVIKSFFLGPQAENGEWLLEKWNSVLENWVSWRRSLFASDGVAISDADKTSVAYLNSLAKIDSEVSELLLQLENETPKFTPRYIGHMVSEVSLPALFGHVCALLHNPNNTSREVSRVTSRLEDEAILDLGKMLGYSDTVCGHFTSGGTMANFEALWHAIVREDERYGENSFLKMGPWKWGEWFQTKNGRAFPGFVVLVPGNKHYSWEKAVTLMGLGADAFWTIALDDQGRLDVDDLESKIQRAKREGKPILMVVSVVGTTELGDVDPVDRVQDVLDRHSVDGRKLWHHVDGAFGGYFASMIDGGELEQRLAPSVAKAFRAIRRVDSVTIDPHKMGYVPYACGAFLVRDQLNYRTRQVSAAYLHGENKSRWAVTLEGSRSGAGVTATWLSNRVLGLGADGYGRLLSKGIDARDIVRAAILESIPEALIVNPSDLNVLCFSVAASGALLSNINRKTVAIFKHFERSPHFSVSKTVMNAREYGLLLKRMAKERSVTIDCDEWIQIRLVLMNPFLIAKETKTNLVKEFVDEVKLAASLSP